MSKAELNPADAIVARKTLKLNGRVYQAGDEIKDSTVDYRTRAKLFRVGVVVLKDIYDAKQVVVEKEVFVEEVTTTSDEAVVDETVASEETIVANGETTVSNEETVTEIVETAKENTAVETKVKFNKKNK